MLGDVNTPARFPANAAGEHILDTITRAGGPKSQGYDTWVMLERGARREIVPFGALVYEPRLNDIWTTRTIRFISIVSLRRLSLLAHPVSRESSISERGEFRWPKGSPRAAA